MITFFIVIGIVIALTEDWRKTKSWQAGWEYTLE